MNTLVHYRLDNAVAILQLANGKANAISPALIEALHAALDQAEKDQAVTLITGQPGMLSGGYDLKVMLSGPQQALQLVASGSALARRMLTHPYPLIVACPGHAVAKGAFLLLAADYRLASEGDFKIGLNEVQIGMTMHHAGLVLARDRLTPAALQRAVINAEMMNPQQAMQAGFVDQVVPAEELMPTALQLARDMQALNMKAHHQTKLRLRAQLLADLDSAIEADLQHRFD